MHAATHKALASAITAIARADDPARRRPAIARGPSAVGEPAGADTAIRVAFVATGSTMTTYPCPGVQIPVAGAGAGD